MLVGKRVVDFLFAIGLIEHFTLALTVRTLYADIGRSRRFSKGLGHFERKFKVEGDIAHQPKISAVCSFVSHKARV